MTENGATCFTSQADQFLPQVSFQSDLNMASSNPPFRSITALPGNQLKVVLLLPIQSRHGEVLLFGLPPHIKHPEEMNMDQIGQLCKDIALSDSKFFPTRDALHLEFIIHACYYHSSKFYLSIQYDGQPIIFYDITENKFLS